MVSNPFFFSSLTIGAVTLLAILPLSKWLLPSEWKLLSARDRFSQGEIASGKFPWTRQKEQKKFLMTEFPRYVL